MSLMSLKTKSNVKDLVDIQTGFERDVRNKRKGGQHHNGRLSADVTICYPKGDTHLIKLFINKERTQYANLQKGLAIMELLIDE